jgi:RNase P/RNase MRP subunit POP5
MVRFKCRYLLCETQWGMRAPPNVTSSELLRSVRQAVTLQLGELGAAHISQSVQIKYWNGVTGVAIVRVARDFAALLRHCVESLSELKHGVPGVVRVLHTAGSMKLCQSAALRVLGSPQAVDEIRNLAE